MAMGELTVRPFLSVVVSVLMAGEWCGVASPRLDGRESPPARPRRPCARFRASLRDAMEVDVKAEGGVENERFEGNLERSGSSLQKTTVCSVILPHFPGQLGNARAKQAATSSRHVAELPSVRHLLLGIFGNSALSIGCRLAVVPELRSSSADSCSLTQ